MPISPKKLSSHSRSVRIFYIGTEQRLTNIEAGSSVWIHFRAAYREFLARRARLPFHYGRGKSVADPILYIGRTYAINLKRQDRLVWSLINPISAGRQATEDDFIILQMETSLESS
jgi:hypothetical protein